MNTYKVVFHIDDSEKKRMAIGLGNIENLIAAAGGAMNVDATLLINGLGAGILNLLDEADLARIAALDKQGIRFRICRNCMTKYDMTEADLPATFQTVPAGIVELIRLQSEEDCAYVKP